MNILSIMVPLGAFLSVSIGGLLIRALTAIGVGYIVYEGLSLVVGQAIAMAQSKFNGLPSAVLSIAGLAGFGECLGILTAAILFRVSLTANRKVLGVLNK